MLRPPALACDSHIHIFGPYARYPLDAARKYTPAEGTLHRILVDNPGKLYRFPAASGGTMNILDHDQSRTPEIR